MLLVFFNDFLAQQKGFSVPAATLVHMSPGVPCCACRSAAVVACAHSVEAGDAREVGSRMRPGMWTRVGVCTQVVAVFGIGSGVGVIVGGMIGQFLYNKRRRYMPLFTGALTVRCTPPLQGGAVPPG
jgi:hypothetical protein